MDSIANHPKCPFQEPAAKRTRTDLAPPTTDPPTPNIVDEPPPKPPSGSVNIAPSLEPDEDHRDRMQKSLRHFDVLDEVQGDQSDASDGERDGQDYSSDTDLEGNVAGNETGSRADNDDLDEEAIEELLNEGLPEDIRNKKKELQYVEKFKTVLEEFEQNHFEVLPEGWVQVTHNSGMPLFLHTASRVCSATQPYFLGPGSVRKHEIPISAIPCYSYRRSLAKEELRNQQPNEAAETDSKTTNPTTAALLPISTQAVIETARENLINESLTADQMNEYCRTLFRFKKIRVMRFKSWNARRKFTKSKKHIKSLHRPTLPDGTKLISFPIHHHKLNNLGTTAINGTQSQSTSASTDDTGGVTISSTATSSSAFPRQRREWIMNPNGKSYVCILHEYVQHALKKQPTYEFKELENAATPYSATVSINDLKYGTGFGTSKKQAKSEAARETLEALIPEMRDKIKVPGSETQAKATENGGTSVANGEVGQTSASSEANAYNKDVSVFDEIRIEDPRVTEFCSKTTEPLPHAILLTCLQRNYGLGEVQISYQVNTVKHKRNEFTMTVGKHTVTVACKNKRDGKHRAAQAILQTLHPHVRTWGSLLRLYGNHSVKSFKEKKQEEQQITGLQSKAAINQPNYAILDKLRLEMTKLMERRASVRPIGTFLPPLEMDLPSSSAANLKNVEL